MHKEMNVPRRTILLSVAVIAAAGPLGVFAQATAPQYFAVCASQPNLPTVYFSGVLQGPATAFQALRNGFNQYLAQHYAYKGVVGCVPAANAAIALNAINTQSTALRKAKKTVIDTGWTESVAPPAQAAAMAAPNAPTRGSTAAGAGVGATGNGGAGGTNGATSGSSELTNILAAVFGNGSGAGNGTGSQNSLSQVSGALSSVFASAPGKAPASANMAPQNTQPASADTGLGSAQADSTKLVVYGCGRQANQVACVTELTNQNQKSTLVQSANVWKDAFIVDDRGDRHLRTSGFFLNIDGDQRAQLDISYGKTARFILMFDGVQTKVQKVALRSTAGGLDVEDIALVPPAGGSGSGE